MKHQLTPKVNRMNILAIAVLTAGLGAGIARAESGATYDATVGARFVDLDSKRNKQQAMEYDGKQYSGAHGDVSVSNQGDLGLFDFSLKDIGSKEEMMNFALDYKSALKISAKWENLHHRMNPLRHGEVVNGVWRPNNIGLTTGAERFTYISGTNDVFREDPNALDFKIKRTETEANIALYQPDNSARWVSLQYWSTLKKGSKYSQTSTNNVGEGFVDNTKIDLTLGLGSNVGENGALSVDVVRSEFRDDSVEVSTNIATGSIVPLLPHWSDHQMSGAEMRWKYNAGKNLSLTGAITGRQRENLINQYKANIGVAALNAAYTVNDKLSVVNRLYTRYFEIDENTGFIGFNSSGKAGQGSQLDKLHVRDEIIANFHPTEKIHTKASYKIEVIHRRDAPTYDFVKEARYADGLVVPAYTASNAVAVDETKHTMSLGATVELPLGIEAEGGYKKLYANRPAFINQATRADDLTARVQVPLPGHLEFMVGSDYTKERNANGGTNYHMSRNAYYTGLDWEHKNKMFFGVDGSYESIRYNMEQYYGIYNAINTIPEPGNVNIPHEGGAPHRERNTTVGAHGRVVCPKGFVVMGNGSYTWSTVNNPVNFGWSAAQAAAAFTPAGTYVNDFTPGDVRVARGTLGVEYTPEKYKNLTAKASYSVTDWVDKVDTYMSGRASVAQLGASMKF